MLIDLPDTILMGSMSFSPSKRTKCAFYRVEKSIKFNKIFSIEGYLSEALKTNFSIKNLFMQIENWTTFDTFDEKWKKNFLRQLSAF